MNDLPALAGELVTERRELVRGAPDASPAQDAARDAALFVPARAALLARSRTARHLFSFLIHLEFLHHTLPSCMCPLAILPPRLGSAQHDESPRLHAEARACITYGAPGRDNAHVVPPPVKRLACRM